jgi:hypothetical protein
MDDLKSTDSQSPKVFKKGRHNRKRAADPGKMGWPVQKGERYGHFIWKRFVRHKAGVVSLIILCVLALAAILAPIIAPYDPQAIAGDFSGVPNLKFLLGTDQIGRDVLSRLLFGARVSLFVGFLATGIDIRVFWRVDRYGHYALYGYGYVISLYPACTCGSCHIPTRNVEYYFNTGIC